MRLHPDFYEKDRPLEPGETIGKTLYIEIPSSRGRLQGFVLTPDSRPGEKHPAVVMCHGFPGIASNHELGQALRRAGFVVFNPYAPGAWGSDGFYSLDGIADAAADAARYAAGKEMQDAYGVDPENVFLLGHSMGGFAVVNAMRREKFVKGAVLIAPCDIDWYFRKNELDFVHRLPQRAVNVLKTDCDLYENACMVHESMGFPAAAGDLRDRNLMLVVCEQDEAIPPDMAVPFFASLQGGAGVKRLERVDTDHAFNNKKNAVAKLVTEFLAALAEK